MISLWYRRRSTLNGVIWCKNNRIGSLIGKDTFLKKLRRTSQIASGKNRSSYLPTRATTRVCNAHFCQFLSSASGERIGSFSRADRNERVAERFTSPRYIVANCWPLFPDFTRRYDRPSTFGIDRRASSRPKRKKNVLNAQRSLEEVSFRYFFVLRVFWKPSVNEVTNGIQTKWHSCANINVDKLRLKNNRLDLKRIW